MKISYKITRHPTTKQFERAAWIDLGRCCYVAFPDGRWYHEKYCVWEVQEEAIVREEQRLLAKTA
jgi:hypothetical protein